MFVTFWLCFSINKSYVLSWCQGYQFWTRADANGIFTIRNVQTGDYNLYAWVPGFIGDYKYDATIKITSGHYKLTKCFVVLVII